MKYGSSASTRGGIDMDLIVILIGLGALGVVAIFSILAARSQAKFQSECVKLDGCATREQEIAVMKVRGR